MLKVGSPTIPIYAFLYSQVDAYLTKKITSKKEGYAKEIARLDSQRNSIIKHDARNLIIIMARDGLSSTTEIIRQLGVELKENVQSHSIYQAAENSYRTLFNWGDYMLSFGLVANEIRKDDSLFVSRADLQQSSWQMLQFFSWFKETADTAAKIETPLHNVATLVELIRQPTNDNDQIDRVVKDGTELILENLEIGYGERTLVTIDKLNLKIGKIYAVTGETGCGKSSFLSKIKGIKEEDGAFGTGSIYYPAINGSPPKIVMISQDDYFPIGSSLEEVIYYPDKVPTNKQEVESLLQKLSVRGFYEEEGSCVDGEKELTLASIEDWYSKFSGGEKKKIAIISAIIKKPNILLLDEIFSAFDPDTIRLAQKIITEYLPNSLILIVDHQAKNNNYNGFYSGGELHFSNQRIVHQEITD